MYHVTFPRKLNLAIDSCRGEAVGQEIRYLSRFPSRLPRPYTARSARGVPTPRLICCRLAEQIFHDPLGGDIDEQRVKIEITTDCYANIKMGNTGFLEEGW